MNTYCLIVAIIFVVSLGVFSARSLEEYQPSGPLAVSNGELAQSVEAHYNEHFPIKNIGINIWTALQYELLGEGKRGIIVGDDGWFYSDEEFKSYQDVSSLLQQRFKQIEQIASYLESYDSRLVLVLVPTKASIYSEHTNGHRPADFYDNLYQQGLNAAKSIDVLAPDLRFAFLQAKRQLTNKNVFLKTDTHWTPYGAGIAAQVVARDLVLNNIISPTPEVTFSTEQVGQIEHQGDLLNYLPLGFFSDWLAPPLEELPIFSTTAENSSEVDLFSDTTIDTVLVGSSYSANPSWNFAGALKQFTGRDLVNYAEEGQGPILPMLAYLDSSDFHDHPPELLIWEFPERFLPVPYNTEPYAHLFEHIKGPEYVGNIGNLNHRNH